MAKMHAGNQARCYILAPMKPGELHNATMDGAPCVVYLSLTCEGKGVDRLDNCLRYAPPLHSLVTAPEGRPVSLNRDGEPNYAGLVIHGPVEYKRTHGK